MLKYAELNTKKDNIQLFLKQLKTNLEQALGKYDVHIQYDKGRMFVEAYEEYDAILDVLTHTFGIHEVVLGYELPSNDLKGIEEELKNVIREKD